MKRPELKRRILSYTVAMIRSNGANGFTVDDISNGLGISKRTFYEVYPGKAVLLEECFIRMATEGRDKINRILEDEETEPLERLISMTDNYMSFLHSGRKITYLDSAHGYNIGKLQAESACFWHSCFRRIFTDIAELLENPAELEDTVDLLLHYLKFTERAAFSKERTVKAVRTFVRGTLNMEGINKLDCAGRD